MSNAAKPKCNSLSDTASDISYPVETIRSSRLVDRKRNKELELKVYLPAANRMFPVIIFSHGAGASKDAYARLARFWCSHGYVVILPSHDDSMAVRKKLGLPCGFEDIVEEIKTDYAGWKNRACDLLFIIESLPALKVYEPRLKERLNHKQVGVGGHSYGAFAAMLAGGIRVDAGPQRTLSFPRCPDLKALLLLSPAGASCGSYGISPSSFADLTGAMMTMTGSLDTGFYGQPAAWRTESYKFALPGDKYLVFIEGATHMSFTGSNLKGFLGAQEMKKFGPRLTGFLEASKGRHQGDAPAPEELTTPGPVLSDTLIFKCIKDTTLAFWAAYLKGKKASLEHLYSQHAEFPVDNAVLFSRK